MGNAMRNAIRTASRNATRAPAPTSKWYHDRLSNHVDEACEWMLKDDPLANLDDQDLLKKIYKGFDDGDL